jgi:hypothetical protein
MYGRLKGAYSVYVGRPKGKGQIGRTGVDGRIILRLIFK